MIVNVMRPIVAVLIIGLSLSLISCERENVGVPVDLQLDSRIQPADQNKYKSVLDASNWANLYLIVQQEGVEVISKAMTPNRKLIPVNELRKTLLGLPVTAWPYGRVVVIQDPGIPGDNPGLQKQNKHKTEQILQSLQIRIERWPSA